MDTAPAIAIAIVTYDRPGALRACLESLCAHPTRATAEIIIVDNHPASGLAAPVVREFPGVRYIEGPGRGHCSGRNAAVAHRRAPVIAWTNDDCVVPPGWADALLAQFTRPEIAIVCGNVLPLRVETSAEQLFARYNTTVRGSERVEYTRAWLDRTWHKSPQTQWIGVGNNFATRVAALHDPRVRGFNETLGAGTPVGSADDQYLWYATLRAGYTVVYEPSIVIYDSYEETMGQLERKLFSYGKAMIGYELELLTRHGDLRALTQLALVLPAWRARQLARVLWRVARGRGLPDDAPLLWHGLRGNLAGLAAWRASRRAVRHRVQRESREPSALPGDRAHPAADRARAVGEPDWPAPSSSGSGGGAPERKAPPHAGAV